MENRIKIKKSVVDAKYSLEKNTFEPVDVQYGKKVSLQIAKISRGGKGSLSNWEKVRKEGKHNVWEL